MDWTDPAVVLSARRYGEGSAVVTVLSRSHGRHAGLVRGGAGKAARGVLQPGNMVQATWRARLAEHLGHFTCEMLTAHAAAVLDDADRLAALSSACALAEATLPEREPHVASFEALSAFLESLASEAWPTVYVHWELALLRDLGYGLDLGRCAVTGSSDDLAYVSPKSGCAVSLAAAGPYKDRLLPLPRFLTAGGEGDAAGVAQGLRLTGWFLERNVLGPRQSALPSARSRLVDRFRA